MRELPLSKGAVALVDDGDYERLKHYSYHLCNGYASRWTSGGREARRRVFLHQDVLQTADGLVPDHINRNKLDCRKDNLRPATRSQNQRNRAMSPRNKSGYRGVDYRRDLGKYRAVYRHEGQTYSLGFFVKAEDAAVEWDKAALRYDPEFAQLNFPRENYR